MNDASLPDDQTLTNLFTFLEQAGDLKDTLRSGFTNAGSQESTAEHCWRLGLMVVVLEPYLHGYDISKMLKMALIHDLGEAVTGDVPAIHQTGDPTARREAERRALENLTAPLGAEIGTSMRSIAAEYDEGLSREAAFMKGLDKLETIFQHLTGNNTADIDHAFNLTYGETWTRDHPLLARLRTHIDAMTKARLADAALSG